MDASIGGCAAAHALPELEAAWQAARLRQLMQRVDPGAQVQIVATLPSTNTALLQRCRQALSEPASGSRFAPALLVAQAQTQGRGRMGRSWLAREGESLTFSLALQMQREHLAGLSLAVGVALAEALHEDIGLKWPNDLVLADGSRLRKLGGILVETLAMAGRRCCVIGVGLNVGRLGVQTGEAGDFDWASLQTLQPGLTPAAALAAVAPALLKALQNFEAQGFAPFAAGFARRDVLAGRAVCASPGPTQDALTGQAMGVDDAGALRLKDAQDRVHRVSSGEVSVRLLARTQDQDALTC